MKIWINDEKNVSLLYHYFSIKAKAKKGFWWASCSIRSSFGKCFISEEKSANKKGSAKQDASKVLLQSLQIQLAHWLIANVSN